MARSQAADQGVPHLRNAGRGKPRLLQFALQVVRTPIGAGSAVVILLLIAAAAAAPLIAPYDQFAISRDNLASPSLDHWAGTDSLGRDQFSRLLHGARTSLWVGLLAVAFGTLTGSFIGLVSGFAGGKVDLVIQRVVDAVLSLPGLVLAMALVAVFGASTTNALLAIAIVIAPSNSRVVRSAVFAIRENTYVEAAASIGASPLRVMLRHILPNVVAPILILISASLGGAILIEAGLSFLGLGTQPPNASWGRMLSTDGRNFMQDAPWLAIFPGLAISITVLAFNLLGDVVRDVLDPRLRGTR